MTTGLSDYQIAVLQAMNIPVFQRQGEAPATQTSLQANPAPEPKSASGVVSKSDAQSRLASLKAAMAPDNKAGVTSTANASVTEEPKVVKQSVNPQFSAFTQDITLALDALNVSATPALFVGQTMTTNRDEIELPSQPDKLTTAQKRALWQSLSALN